MLDLVVSTMADHFRSTLVDMETMGERLRAEREAAELTQQQLATEAGVTKQAISQIESGATKNPEASTLEPICRRLNVNLRWLQSKIGPKRPSEAATDEEVWPEVTAYDQGASLGDGITAEDWQETHKLKFRAASLRKQGLNAATCAVYYGRGDSMEPRIRDGDAILFNTEETDLVDDKIFMIRYDGHEYAKRMMKLGSEWFMVSENKDDPKWRKPRPVEPHKHFEVLGRVRWIGSWEE